MLVLNSGIFYLACGWFGSLWYYQVWVVPSTVPANFYPPNEVNLSCGVRPPSEKNLTAESGLQSLPSGGYPISGVVTLIL